MSYNGQPATKLRIGEGQTTREQSRRLQAIGNRSESPLTRKGEGEEIVFARSERKWLLA